MKKIQIITILIFIFSYPGQSLANEKSRLIMGWEPWAPFAYASESDRLTGLDIDIVASILSKYSYSIDYQKAPWARLLKLLENGEIHICASAMKTPEREKFAYFSFPYQKETYLLFVRKGEASHYNLKRLQDIIGTKFRLGILRGSLYGSEFERLMKDPDFSKHVEDVTTDEQNHIKLLANRFDGFIQEYSRMVTDGRKSGIINQVEPLFVIEENILHVMFSKKSVGPEVVDSFNEGLKIMMKDGTYQKIFEKYNLERYNMISPIELSVDDRG
ncbi:transporter substrate-binding domain-containing protein [Desulfatiferula olefinivorans]